MSDEGRTSSVPPDEPTGPVAGAVTGAVTGARHTISDLGGFLREQRQQARMSLRQLAAAAGVSNPYLSQVERGLRRPSAEVLQQIAKGLRISAEALYVRAGLLDGTEGSDVPVAVAADPYLSERQKRVLLDVYASFVSAGPDAAPDAAPPHAPDPGGTA
ncbi:helix-turn-helix domain-containing protein [Aquipuribacter hungaricus]|uniref:Helix-turn-helix domain-containing protein n=1 Tax=Aquipuribacter hungaricus TaxID=545624 RepID=A0ABV7WBE1_9MICO